MKCTPWQPTSKSIKASDSEAYDTFVAFKMTLNYYFENEGEIEFRYRKDT
jgi:hypothetical protein